MEQQKKSKIDYIVSVVGVIILGALGSGFWSGVLGPFLSWVIKVVLTMVSFGIVTIKNSVYSEIATGLHEQSGLFILLALSAVIFTIPQTLVIISYSDIPIISKIKELVKKTEKKKVLKVLSLIMLFLATIIVISVFFSTYENEAITHFNQSFSICKPYMENNKKELVQSKFSQIKSKEDYVQILNQLNEIAKTNGQKLPEFEAW